MPLSTKKKIFSEVCISCISYSEQVHCCLFKAAPDKLGLKENQRKSFLEAGDLQVSSSKPVTGNGNKKRVEDFETEKVKGKER